MFGSPCIKENIFLIFALFLIIEKIFNCSPIFGIKYPWSIYFFSIWNLTKCSPLTFLSSKFEINQPKIILTNSKVNRIHLKRDRICRNCKKYVRHTREWEYLYIVTYHFWIKYSEVIHGEHIGIGKATICLPPEQQSISLTPQTNSCSWNGYALAPGLHDHLGPGANMINAMVLFNLAHPWWADRQAWVSIHEMGDYTITMVFLLTHYVFF